MSLFKTKLARRMSLAKTIGFIFGLLAFCLYPVFFNEPDLMFRIAMLLRYTTLGGLIGVFGFMDRHPVFANWYFPWWFRGVFLGAWMNLLLVLFIYEKFIMISLGTGFEGMSPYWMVLEGAIVGLIVDYFATKFGGEGKELFK